MAHEPKTVLEKFPTYEICIGIEVHVQLATKSKIFCACPNGPTEVPNSHLCEICAGYPGTLPVLNHQVVEYAILAGLGTHCAIAPRSEFARKHYFYPDLPKGYQITQNDLPICSEGLVPIRLDDGTIKNIRLIRIHIEEDAGKNIHAPHTQESFVNLNRAGTPLLEIVSYPDITNAQEAKAYLKSLHTLVRSLGICSGNMEEGAFRADTNISVRKKGQKELGTRCELKNINSFKYICDAIEYEAERQILLLEAGNAVVQQTRLWNVAERKTHPMRSKEEAADYRYFPEPDLPLLEVSEERIAQMRAHLPELPYDKYNRYVQECGLTDDEAEIISEDPALAAYFEKAYAVGKSKLVVNWILRDVIKYLKDHKIALDACNVTPEKLAAIVQLIEIGTISNNAAQEVFALVAQSGGEPADIVKERGLEQMEASDELRQIIATIIANEAATVERYKAGEQKLFGFFVGEVMKQTKGKANPQAIQKILKEYLA